MLVHSACSPQFHVFCICILCICINLFKKNSYTQSDHCLLSSHDMIDYLGYSAKTYRAVLFTGVPSREVADERLGSSKEWH